jgi:hypothetical protein
LPPQLRGTTATTFIESGRSGIVQHYDVVDDAVAGVLEDVAVKS